MTDATNGRGDYQVLVKADEKRYTLGVVYEPDEVDTQGEFAKAEDIEAAAWGFLERLQTLAKSGAEFVASALKAEDGDAIEFDCSDLEDVAKGAGLDDEHLQVDEDVGTIVESYLAPIEFELNGEVVRKGAWILGVKWTPEMFAKIKAGERTGLSMFGRAQRAEE